VAGAGDTSKHDVGPPPTGAFVHGREYVACFDIDRGRAQARRHIEAQSIAARAGDDDIGRTGGERGLQHREALVSGSLDDHRSAGANPCDLNPIEALASGSNCVSSSGGVSTVK
jgi:hypothetical protein